MCSCLMSMGTSLALSWGLHGYGRCGCKKVSLGWWCLLTTAASLATCSLLTLPNWVAFVLVSFLPFYDIIMFALWVARRFGEVTAQELS